MTRPTQITGLSGNDFAAYYWLKEDLVAFCRANGIPTSGSKQALTERIKLFLDTGEIAKPQRKKRPSKSTMPATFTRETIIGENWRCSQDLRAFFEAEIGKSFHFNQYMRAFIKQDGVGQSLQAAIDGWLLSKSQPKGSSDIAPQFEYNRHFREYFAKNPNGSRAEAIAAWNEKKAQRKS
ncbi:MAG: DUF6434 domain-containing protein [Chloroflexota bacterium]